ncbi:MAG: ArsR/SmtB family transcription factor [Tumebacillaceae bacterium]
MELTLHMTDNPSNRKHMFVTIEQSKLLASAIRTKILSIIENTPHTAKQVADLLQKTPGNVHYHMQRLYEGGIINLVESREVGGVVEKYYLANAVTFTPMHDEANPDYQMDHDIAYRSAKRIRTRLLLSQADFEQMTAEIYELMGRWVAKLPVEGEQEEMSEYSLGIELLKLTIDKEGKGEE